MSKNLRFLTSQLLLLILLVLHTPQLDALKCICDLNDCDNVQAEECPGRGVLVWDPCRCCRVCAKTVGETCGGPGGFSGTCEPPLKCISKPPIIGTGVCLELPLNQSSLNTQQINRRNLSSRCADKIEILPGCEIVERRCQCWRTSISVCSESSVTKWDFANDEDCKLNLQNLIEQELDFDEDFTIPPESYSGPFLHKIVAKRRKNTQKRKSKRFKKVSSEWR